MHASSLKKFLANQYIIPIAIYLTWRIAIFVYQVYLQDSIIPANTHADSLWEKTIYAFVKYWDALYYTDIAQTGYTHLPLPNFFPVFPLILRFLNLLFRDIVLTSTIFNFLNGLLLSILFFKSSKLFTSEPIKNLILFLTFPGTLFILANYAEGLLITLTLATILLTHHQKYFLASIIIGIASGTKLIGTFNLIFLLISPLNIYKKTMYSIIGLSGLALYMLFLHQTFQNPLYFLEAQNEWCRTIEPCILTFPLFTPFIKLTELIQSPSSYTTLYLDVIYTFFLFTLCIVLNKKIHLKYLLYSLLTVLPWLSTGKITSMTRYVIVAIPLFLVLTKIIRHEKLFTIIVAGHFVIQLILIGIFTNYVWVG